MISLISLNRDGSFDLSYSENGFTTKREQSFVELTTRNSKVQQEEFDPDHINTPEVKNRSKNTTISHEADSRTRFYSIQDDQGGIIPAVMDVKLSSRRLSTLYDDWVREETDQQIEKTEQQFLRRFNRLYMMNKLDNTNKFSKNNKFGFSLNLTQLMLAQMNVSQGLQNLLIINIIIDMIYRANFVIFIYVIATDNHNFLTYLLLILCLPRLFHIFSMTTLLFLNKYDLNNKSFLNLSHLVRSNFIEEDGVVNDNLHPLRRPSVCNVINVRSVLFMVLPIELCFISLPRSTAFEKRRSLKTYILMSYILKGIEAILFQPVLLYLMIMHQEKLASQIKLYEEITLYLVIGDIAKYVVVSCLLLIRGNGQKRATKLRMLNAIHQQSA